MQFLPGTDEYPLFRGSHLLSGSSPTENLQFGILPVRKGVSKTLPYSLSQCFYHLVICTVCCSLQLLICVILSSSANSYVGLYAVE